MIQITRSILAGLTGSALMVFASCSTTSENQDYATYPSSGYGDYGADSNDYNSYGDTQSYADNTSTGSGAGGAYPTSPTDYGTDYGTTSGSTAQVASSSGKTHTVLRGETLYRISKNYGTTVANIKAANGLNTDIIHPGDVLTVR